MHIFFSSSQNSANACDLLLSKWHFQELEEENTKQKRQLQRLELQSVLEREKQRSYYSSPSSNKKRKKNKKKEKRTGNKQKAQKQIKINLTNGY
jgi:hypothetical protein